MGLVRCEACEKDIEAGWNLSQHLIGKAHLKKQARWMADHVPYQRVMPAEVVMFNGDDWDEDQPEPTVRRPDGPALLIRAPTTTQQSPTSAVSIGWAPPRNAV